MNNMRRGLVISYLIVIAFLCVYLPWKIDYQGGRASVGYSFIWSPEDAYFSVDFGRLLLEIIAVTLLAAALNIVLGRRGQTHTANDRNAIASQDGDAAFSDIKMTTPQVADLIKMNVLNVIFLTWITLGLYFPIWILKRKKPLENLHSNEKIGTGAPVTVIVFFSLAILFYFMSGFTKHDDISVSNGFETLGCVSNAIGGFTQLFLNFKCRRILVDHFNDYLQKDIRFSKVATFFFGVYYLQYKINRIDV